MRFQEVYRKTETTNARPFKNKLLAYDYCQRHDKDVSKHETKMTREQARYQKEGGRRQGQSINTKSTSGLFQP
ncbi:hypothetical protein SUGI_0285530 [Cryptomeria japonica]|nr:hypothetical protein SUGI_0285530 [Cryptomeria japonica]